MKAWRQFLFAFLVLFLLPILSHPETETINLTPKDLHNHLKKCLRRKGVGEWASYRGKTVHWTGNPRPSGMRHVIDQRFVMDLISEGDMGYIWLRVYLPQEHADELSGLSRYGSVVFEGRLDDYSPRVSGSGYHFLIRDVRLLEVRRAESFVSIVDYRFDAKPSPSSGGYKFREFNVIIRNQGEQALRGLTVEVTFGSVRGTKRNLLVGPHKDEEIMIWFVDEWIVDGQKNMPPFRIPPGLLEGNIRLKDESGQIITSKPFSHSLPPVEGMGLQ